MATLSPTAGGDLALIVGVSAALNLVTNVGIPTLIIRGFREGRDAEHLHQLARAYALLSMIAGVGTALLVLSMTENTQLSLAAGGLAAFQSAFSGLEYWSIGASTVRYDKFLLGGAPTQAAASLTAPLLLFTTGSVALSIVALTCSYILGVVVVAYSERLSTRAMLGGLGVRSWWSDALGLGAVTGLTAALYAIDLFVVRLFFPDALLDYRFALYAVTFLVALLPLNIFVLADAASGTFVRSRLLASLGLVGTLVCGAGAAVLMLVPGYGETSKLLVVLSALCGARLVTQVLVAELNARGGHRSAAVALLAGVLCWLAVGLTFGNFEWRISSLAAAQVGLEWLVVALLAIAAKHVAARREV